MRDAFATTRVVFSVFGRRREGLAFRWDEVLGFIVSVPCGLTAGQGRPGGVHQRPRPPGRLNPIREFPLFVTPGLLLLLLP